MMTPLLRLRHLEALPQRTPPKQLRPPWGRMGLNELLERPLHVPSATSAKYGAMSPLWETPAATAGKMAHPACCTSRHAANATCIARHGGNRHKLSALHHSNQENQQRQQTPLQQ